MNTNESDAYLLRKTSSTIQGLRSLGPAEYSALLKEVYFQESIEEYRRQHGLATILAAIYNTIPRKRGSKVFKASDFLSSEIPTRNKPESELEQLASKHNVKLSTKEIKNRGE